MKIDRRGFFGALGLGVLAAKLSGGTTASAPASPEPLLRVGREPIVVEVYGIHTADDMRRIAEAVRRDLRDGRHVVVTDCHKAVYV